jgi:AcrR family transcriptional regulator
MSVVVKSLSEKKLGRPKDETLQSRRQEEILDAAAKLFAERGYSNTDTQDLADAIQIGKGTLYRYFASKQILFLAAVDRAMHRLRERIDHSIGQTADPLARVEQAIRAYLLFFEEHPECVELLIQERAQFKDRKKPTYFEHREANIGPWLNLFRGLIAVGRVRNVPVERIADVMSNLVYGTMFTNYFAGRTCSVEAQVQDLLDIVFRGILSEDERTRSDSAVSPW